MLTAKLILERLDKDGRLLERREQKSRSFTKHLMDILYVLHAFATLSVNDITSASKTIAQGDQNEPDSHLQIGSPPGLSLAMVGSESSYWDAATRYAGEQIGIQVGTGTTAPTPTDDAMEARIAHGESGDEFEYGGCELIGIAFTDPNGEFTIRRYFTNNSGGSITVNEVGIYSPASTTGFQESKIFLIAHDKVAPGVAVADGQILRVTYVPQITV